MQALKAPHGLPYSGETRIPKGREEQGSRQHPRYLLEMSLWHWLRALPGHFDMDNIASYPERH
ncbi:hypothetical protein, partial [Pseudovibrio sp. W64]|uniref:hypothetical protein n=1 Tax=Pseudovibrio sp. W64 TaxID=1735583 RepID=UPI0019D37C19